jgi:two-component system, sensor histidine kinase and response regulator
LPHRILVVDDDPRLLHVVTTYLSIEGYEVMTAADGEEALRSVQDMRPSLIVLDVMMPGMDGIETCRRIKQDPLTSDIPVLLFTALNRDEDVESGRAAGADRFISKPFSLQGLNMVIQGFLGNPVAA